MSGSGGFYKYRCKYFYSHNCQNWVWVNGSPCASCLAEGRDAEEAVSNAPTWTLSRDIFVPLIHGGTLQYTLMEIVATTGPGNYWTLRHKVAQPIVQPIPTTGATPRAVLASTGLPTSSGA